jgi:hypothetical protein
MSSNERRKQEEMIVNETRTYKQEKSSVVDPNLSIKHCRSE